MRHRCKEDVEILEADYGARLAMVEAEARSRQQALAAEHKVALDAKDAALRKLRADYEHRVLAMEEEIAELRRIAKTGSAAARNSFKATGNSLQRNTRDKCEQGMGDFKKKPCPPEAAKAQCPPEAGARPAETRKLATTTVGDLPSPPKAPLSRYYTPTTADGVVGIPQIKRKKKTVCFDLDAVSACPPAAGTAARPPTSSQVEERSPMTLGDLLSFKPPKAPLKRKLYTPSAAGHEEF